MMETRRPHQDSRSSFLRREVTKKSFPKETVPKSPLVLYTPVKPSFQLARKEDGEKHTSIAKENPKATENLVAARINGTNLHNCISSTPIKTPFDTPLQLQTPTSKLSFLSASGHKHSVGVGVCSMNEDASITRTPFRLLVGKNLNACLFSPSHSPRPSPSAFVEFVSPALKGHAKRVLVMPSQLSPARRVPVKRKGSQLRTAGKQSPFVMAKSSRIDNVPFGTSKSSRVDNVLKYAGQIDDSNEMQHHHVHNVEANFDKETSEGSALPKRTLAFMPQQSPLATANSSRVEHVLKEAYQNSGVSEGKVMQHQEADVKHDRGKLDRLERLLASMPHLSSPARRVPLRQKQKQQIKTPPSLQHKVKQQSNMKNYLAETPKTCKSGQRRGKTCPNEAGAKRQAAGSHQNATKKLQKRVPKAKGGNGIVKAKQQIVDNPKIKSSNSKQCDDDINKKYRDDSVDDSNDVKRCSEDGKLDEACDIDIGCDDAKQYHDAEFGVNDEKQHDDEDGTKHHDGDFGEDGKCQFEDGKDVEKQQEDSHVDIGGSDDTKEHDRYGPKHYEDDDGTNQHDHDDGDNDDEIGVSNDDTDGKRQHRDDNTATAS